MFHPANCQGVTVRQSYVNSSNLLIINDLKKIYKKILANIMVGNESRALSLINELKERNIKPVSRDEELNWLAPWPCTLIESAKAAGAERVKDSLLELNV